MRLMQLRIANQSKLKENFLNICNFNRITKTIKLVKANHRFALTGTPIQVYYLFYYYFLIYLIF